MNGDIHFHTIILPQISVDSSRVVELCDRLMESDVVRLAGLGCRDILRTEAALCLYGNELSDDISPVQAGLAWCIGELVQVVTGAVKRMD